MAGEPVAGCIQGILKGSNERVLHCNILRTGGRFSSNGISFERYSAEHCLLGSTSWGAGKQAPLFTTQSIPLTGFEEWLRLGAIKVEHALGSVTATYKVPDDSLAPLVRSARPAPLEIMPERGHRKGWF
jgi:hypothetical protein